MSLPAYVKVTKRGETELLKGVTERERMLGKGRGVNKSREGQREDGHSQRIHSHMWDITARYISCIVCVNPNET